MFSGSSHEPAPAACTARALRSRSAVATQAAQPPVAAALGLQSGRIASLHGAVGMEGVLGLKRARGVCATQCIQEFSRWSRPRWSLRHQHRQLPSGRAAVADPAASQMPHSGGRDRQPTNTLIVIRPCHVLKASGKAADLQQRNQEAGRSSRPEWPVPTATALRLAASLLLLQLLHTMCHPAWTLRAADVDGLWGALQGFKPPTWHLCDLHTICR